MTDIAYIGLGSNLGDRQAYLEAALIGLASRSAVELLDVSSLFETEPMGVTDQPLFLNACASVRAAGGARQLLGCLTAIEDLHQRERMTRWGPRTLDLDLLLCGDRIVQSADLTLPHPRMTERCFVLVPLCEIAPHLRHPASGRPFDEYCRELADAQRVRRVGDLAAPTLS